MARKNLLADLTDLPEDHSPASTYPMRGAGKSMVRSLDDLAKQADKFLEGETVVELDPSQVDGSFIVDRLTADDQDFHDLVEAIRSQGQHSPILVRPQSHNSGRFQVVFGHRRLRAARELGIMVRAVVKPLDDRAHVIAQGQENSARANLTFIERALFAKRLGDLGYDREVISTALAANAAAVSKMITVTERIPADLIQQIGPAAGVGRERWVELSLLVGKASNRRKIADLVGSGGFDAASSDERFAALYKGLNQAERPVRKSEATARMATWQPNDKAVVADIRNTGKAFSLSMKAKNASRFGEYLSLNLDALYAQFLAEGGDKGD